MKNLNKFLSAAALVFFASNSYAWTLVYANDASGNVTAGTLQSLRNAVSTGSSVKVIVSSPNIQVWSILCNTAAHEADASKGVICYGPAPLYAGWTIGRDAGQILNPPQAMHIIVNTLGQYSQYGISYATGQVTHSLKQNYAMQWYVD